MYNLRHIAFAFACFIAVHSVSAQVPGILNYQGRVAVGTVNFDGSGQFKFALVNADGSTSYWSNDGTSAAGSEPTAAVTLTVTKGLYAVLLGDTTLTNMTAIPASVFTNADVRLRVWFNDGTNGSQLLTPDQRLAAVGYAMMAGSVPDGSITSAKLASGAIGSTQLASGLTLGGTTLGIFSGPLTGNVTGNATTASSFTGSMAGDVTGTQGATVVATVGGTAAASISAGAQTANAATSANTSGSIVKRDVNGDFSANSITVAGRLLLPATTSSSIGILTQGGSRLIHTYGTSNFFAGSGAGNFTTTGNGKNVSVGINTLQSNTTGAYNTVVGTDAMKLNTTGYANAGIGSGALLSNTVGFDNTAAGSSALSANTVGTGNTATGSGALFGNTTAGNNVAIGAYALFNQSYSNSGTSWLSYNVAVGFGALLNNQPVSPSTGINNTAVGSRSLATNSTGSANTACGAFALYFNTTGGSNTVSGFSSMNANTTGANNTASGESALLSNTTGSNNIAIGHVGQAGETSTIHIGTAGTQTAAFMAGISGVTSSGGVAVFINSNGQLGTVTSSRRFKDNIRSMDQASEAILSLRPVTFRYKPEIDPKGLPQWGLIAEEVNEVNPDLVVRDDKGVIQTVRYEQVNAMLLNEFLKDHRRADAKDVEIAKLHEENAAMKKRLAELEAKDLEREEREKAREARLAKLEQFIPAEPKTQTATAANIKTN